MARTIIDLPDSLLSEGYSLCRLLGVSRAEAVRRALRDYLQHNASVKTDGFGRWKAVPDELADTDRRPLRRR